MPLAVSVSREPMGQGGLAGARRTLVSRALSCGGGLIGNSSDVMCPAISSGQVLPEISLPSARVAANNTTSSVVAVPQRPWLRQRHG